MPTGTELERYRIDSVIAAGGFGVTYLAHHVTLGHPLAIKEHFPRQLAYREATSFDIRPTDADTYAWALDRFIQEGQTLARCRHPGVVTVADVFSANGTAYMVLGYEQGRSFKDWLASLGRRPSQGELDRILVPLLDALGFVHSQELLHRDIAPDNIMIRDDGSPCLIDFGAARQAVAERSALMSAIVKSGFSPPEQYTRSGRAQGPWSDIYALGATLYRAVGGTPPPEATERQIEDDLRPIADLVPEDAYRAEFLAAIDWALRLPPAARPRSIDEWRRKLAVPGRAPNEREPRDPPVAPVDVRSDFGAVHASGAHLPEPATKSPARSLLRIAATFAGALVLLTVLVALIGSQTAKLQQPLSTPRSDSLRSPAPGYGEGIAVSGAQYQGTTKQNLSDCTLQCRNDRKCAAYSYNRLLQACTLYLSVSSTSRSPDYFSDKVR